MHKYPTNLTDKKWQVIKNMLEDKNMLEANSPRGKVHLIRGKVVHFPGEKRRNSGRINFFGGKVHQKSGKMVHFPQKTDVE